MVTVPRLALGLSAVTKVQQVAGTLIHHVVVYTPLCHDYIPKQVNGLSSKPLTSKAQKLIFDSSKWS